MTTYTCPMCSHEIPKDLVVFLDHTKQHIIDSVKNQHPDWVEANGVCGKCVEYLQDQMQNK